MMMGDDGEVELNRIKILPVPLEANHYQHTLKGSNAFLPHIFKIHSNKNMSIIDSNLLTIIQSIIAIHLVGL